jgi:Flp pilus assembly protein TadD
MRVHLAIIVGLTLAVVAAPSTAHAQLDIFARAVHQLAEATEQPEPSRINEIRAAADRMGTALVEWDRRIRALEARVDREIASASDQRAHQLHVELGVTYRARGRIADALREFDAAAELQPSASDLHVLRALTLEVAGRSADAGKAFRAAWNADPRNPLKAYYAIQRSDSTSAAERDRARALLTDTYQRLAFHAAPLTSAPFLTLDVIADNMRRTPVVADDATADGFALIGAGKFSDAVAVLQRADHGSPAQPDTSPLTHLARGHSAEALNHVAEARREYQAALTGALVGRSALYVGIARLAQVEGDPAGAIDAFSRAVRLSPNDPNIHKELASAYSAYDRVDEAFCELMAALLIDAGDGQAHAAIGHLYLDAGRDMDAVTAFTRALELMPEGYETRYALATALMRLGDTAEAARQLDMFERMRRAMLEKRRRDIATDVEKEEAVRRGLVNQGGAR